MHERNLIQALKAAFDVSRGRARYVTIHERVEEDIRIDGIHLCQLIAAMIIASVGLNINSTEAIIGAMLICPLMGSVIAIAYSVATMDKKLLHRTAGGMLLQCILCLITSTLYFLISPLSAQTSQLLTNSTPTVWTIIIALVGGIAGALGMSRRREPPTLISGVAVATALMPPLCSVGYGLSASNPMLAVSALFTFLVNVLFIAFGATIVFSWLRVPFAAHHTGDKELDRMELEQMGRESKVWHRRLNAALVLLTIPCLYFSWATVQRSLAENGTVFEVVDTYDTERLTRELDIVCPGFVSYRVGTEDAYDIKSKTLSERLIATVVTSEELSKIEQQEVEALVSLHVVDVDEVAFEVSESGK